MAVRLFLRENQHLSAPIGTGGRRKANNNTLPSPPGQVMPDGEAQPAVRREL